MTEGRGRREFRIRHGLGRGGFGDVYRATMLSPGGLVAEVAIKLLRQEADPEAESVRRLRDEGKLLAALSHPTILRAYDLAVLDGRVGLVTEYVEGEDLYGLVRAESPDKLPPKALLELVGLVAEGLDAAYHARPDGRQLQLVHRDVKPSNLRLGRHGEVKILDFGIARGDFVDREARTGAQTLGSLPYMAPERFGRRVAGPEADVYSLGCTLFEGLALRRLHLDPTPVEMVQLAADPALFARHIEAAIAALPPVHPEIAALLRETLAHDPAARPSGRELATRCEEIAGRMDGPSLKRWARERTWPPVPVVPGPLDGRTLSDGAVVTGSFSGDAPALPSSGDVSSDTFQFGPTEPAAERADETTAHTTSHTTGHTTSQTTAIPAAPTPSASRAPLLLGLGGLLLLLVAAVGWAAWPDPPAVPVPVPVPVPVRVAPPSLPEPDAPVVAPVPVIPAAPTPERPPAPVPIARPVPRPPPVPAAVPEPVVAPAPVAPAPTPSAPAASGRVRVIGGDLVRLEGPGGSYTTGTVPGDAAYTVFVRVGPDVHAYGPWTVPAGGLLAVRCNAFLAECEPEP